MRLRVTILAAAASVACAASANASYTLTATNATGATSAPFALADFGSAGTNGLVSTAPIAFNGGLITFTPDSSTPNSGLYNGTITNVSSSPYTNTAIAPRNYLTAEPNDPVKITFNTSQTAFNLLWGSVDGYNTLTLDFFSGNTLVNSATVTGPQVASLAGVPANGTTPAFVSITNSSPFTEVVASATDKAFEFVPGVQVPEPASMAVLGASLGAFGFLRRRRARSAI